MKKIQIALIDDSDWKNVYRSFEEFEVDENFSEDEINKKVTEAIRKEKDENDEYTDESVFDSIENLEGFKRGSFGIEYLEFDY